MAISGVQAPERLMCGLFHCCSSASFNYKPFCRNNSLFFQQILNDLLLVINRLVRPSQGAVCVCVCVQVLVNVSFPA